MTNLLYDGLSAEQSRPVFSKRAYFQYVGEDWRFWCAAAQNVPIIALLQWASVNES